MLQHSQIANASASVDFRSLGADCNPEPSHNAIMSAEDKNGGPNHLRAWRVFRGMKGVELAKALDIPPGMVSDLENSNRSLSAKWLRRLAPVLKTTPGFLLDHDPNDLPSDILEIWGEANARQRRQLVEIARTLVATGTHE